MKALINQIRATVKPFADISLARDTDPSAPDMIEGPDLCITADDVRSVRLLMNILNPESFAILIGPSVSSQDYRSET
jgi:hypothetical protein